MVIVIDAVLSGVYTRGVSNYTSQLLLKLAETDKENTYFVFYGRWMKNYEFLQIKQDNFRFICVNAPKGKLSRNLYKSIILPFKAKKLHADVYHVTDTSPLFYRVCPTISTIHDLAEYIYPEKYGKINATIRKCYLPLQVRISNAVITVSEYSKRTLVERFQMKPEKVVVTYNGIGFSQNDERKILPYENRKFFISVSVLEKGKNVLTLVKAYAKLPEDVRRQYPLKLIGNKASEYQEIMQVIENNKLYDEVEICDFVTSEKLKYYYANALALVFPSLYEGFGMPIAESFYFGTPVISSDATCLPEICGDGALLFSPMDEEGCAECMMKLVNGMDLWHEKSQKGMERIREFSWEKTAQKTLQLYKEQCKGQK